MTATLDLSTQSGYRWAIEFIKSDFNINEITLHPSIFDILKPDGVETVITEISYNYYNKSIKFKRGE